MKILVVDDEKLLVKGVKFNLETRAMRWSAPTMGLRRGDGPERPV